MVLILSNKVTFFLGYIINLDIIDSLAHLLVLIMAFLFILSMTFLLVPGCTLLLILGSGEGLLYSVALLAWFIPALLIPDGLTTRNTTKSKAKQAQERENLEHG